MDYCRVERRLAPLTVPEEPRRSGEAMTAATSAAKLGRRPKPVGNRVAGLVSILPRELGAAQTVLCRRDGFKHAAREKVRPAIVRRGGTRPDARARTRAGVAPPPSSVAPTAAPAGSACGNGS